MGKIYVIMSSDSGKLFDLCRYEYANSFHENKTLCKFFKIKTVNALDYVIWNKNNGTPPEIEHSLGHFLTLFKHGSFKSVIVLTNNIFALSFINRIIKNRFMKSEDFLAYTYTGRKFKKETVSENGIMPKYLLKEYKKQYELIGKMLQANESEK